ncbi:armadillo-type protein [Paraphysoderma sedebokerense]|nr:armadillo-type protein [Paraphysoderma sedebokerense]
MHLRPSFTDIMQSTQPNSSEQFPMRRRTDSRVGLEPDAIPDEVNDIIRRTIKSNQTLSFSTDQLTTSNCLLTLQAAINKTFTSDAINDKTSFINNTTLFPFEKPVSENTDHDIKNTKSAKQFISAFLDFYLIVRNYEANSHLFTIKDICESIILRLLTFSWMMVDLQKSAVEMSEPTSDTSSLAGYLEDTLKLLRIFSRGDPSCRIIGQHNGISLIHHIMNLNPSFTRIQVECCATLANLSINSDNRASMLQVGCLKLVVDNMRRFDNIPEIQTEICAALTNISCYERNATFILQAGGWQLIVRALETYKTHVDLQVQGFHALSSLSKHAKPSSLASMTHLNLATTSRAMSGTNTSIASTDMNDLLKCIFTAMKLHKLEAEVVIATCNTLGSLSLSAQSSIRLQEMEIVTMIFEGMKRFRLNDNYQVSACFALAHLFFSNALPLHLATPGIELILRAMKQFPFHESLQTTASFLLGTVTSLEKNRHELFKHDGVPLILAAMGRVYPNEERRRGAIRIVPSQAIANDPVVEAEQHQQNRSTNTRAENGDTNETTDRSRSDNGRSMRTNQISKHFLLQMFGCVALLNLSSEDDGRRQEIIEMGAIHYVYQASQKNREASTWHHQEHLL